MRSLKDRLEKVEALLRTAGILQDEDLRHDFSDMDDEDSIGEDDQTDRRPESSGRESSSASRAASDRYENAGFASLGDLDESKLFEGHKSDDSRYFGTTSL